MQKLLFTCLLSLSFLLSINGQQGLRPIVSLGLADAGPLTGLHAELGVGLSFGKNFSTNVRAAHNFSESTQFSADVLYSFINVKRFHLLAGVEYMYSTYEASAYDGYMVPDSGRIDNGRIDCFGFCGNSYITRQQEYGEYGTIAIPVAMEFDICDRISLYGNYSFIPQDGSRNKLRVGVKYQFNALGSTSRPIKS